MKHQSIHEFVKHSKDIDDNLSWNQRFQQAGYYGVEWYGTTWDQLVDRHQWCDKTVGREHYYRIGSRFWFESEQDALVFKLK